MKTFSTIKRFPVLLAVASIFCIPQLSSAASSKGCVGGGFSLLGRSGDQRTIVRASQGLFLTSDISIDSSGDSLGAPTMFTHVVGDGVLYFDNSNVRDHLGERFPCVGCNGRIRTAR